jgi:dynein intermediate chain, cytosolic
VIYNKEVQTTVIEIEPLMDYEEELRHRMHKEREIEAERTARDKELEEESVKLDEEIEQEIRGARICLAYDYLNIKTDGVRTFGGGTS